MQTEKTNSEIAVELAPAQQKIHSFYQTHGIAAPIHSINTMLTETLERISIEEEATLTPKMAEHFWRTLEVVNLYAELMEEIVKSKTQSK